MAGQWDPTDVHWALSPEFLTPIADVLWKVHAKVAKHVQPHEGDDIWVAGCTAYKRRCVALEKMNLDPKKPWFWAGFVGNHFTVRIHGFPIRIYRAPEEREPNIDGDIEVPERYANPSQGELEFLGDALELPLGKLPARLYRIEVLTRQLGKPVLIRLVEISGGNILRAYAIPVSKQALSETTPADISPIHKRTPPVIPPLADVKPKKRDVPKKDTGEANA